MLLQSPKVQTALARKLVDKVNDGTEAELTIGRIQILPFKTVILRDVAMTDNNPLTTSFFEPRDTVFRIGMATVSFSLKGLTGKKPLTLKKVTVRDGMLNLVTEAPQVTNLKRIFHGGTPKPMQDKGDILLIKQVEARNFHFTLANAMGKKKPKGSPGINWADLDLFADAKGHDLHIVSGTVQGTVDDLKVREKSGYAFWNAHGKTIVRKGNVSVTDFELTDAGSHLVLPSFAMLFEDHHSFKNFTDEVSLEVQIRNSHLNSKTLTGFTGLVLPPLDLDIPKAEYHGPVNDFDLTNLTFREKSGISGQLSGSVRGILNPRQSYIDARLSGLHFTTKALSDILEGVAPGKLAALKQYAPSEPFTLDGHLSGPAERLTLDFDLSSPSGGIRGAVKATDLLEEKIPSHLNGSLAVNNLNLGQLLGTDEVGECTLRTSLGATLGKGKVHLNIDSLHVDKALIHGYEYSNIAGAGTFKDNAFNGRIVCSDPNLNFIFQGLVNLSNKTDKALYKFYFNLGYADLYALNLDKRGPSKASLAVNADFTRIGKKNILGDIDVHDLKLENKEGVHDIGDLSVSSYSSDGDERLQFNAPFAQARYSGSQPVLSLVSDLKQGILYKELPALAPKSVSPWEPKDYRLTLQTRDTRDLLSFVLPGLYLADGTSLELKADGDGTMRAELKSQRLALQDKYIKNFQLQATEDGRQLRCDIEGEELNAGVRLLGNNIRITADSNRVDLRYLFDNHSEQETRGDLQLACLLDRDPDRKLVYDLRTESSELVVGGEKWDIDPSSIAILPSGIKVPRFVARNDDQQILVSGGIAKGSKDTLTLSLNDLDLGPLRMIAASLPEIGGKVTGNARLVSPVTKDQLDLNARMVAKDMVISGYDAGTLKVSGEWENTQKQMLFSLEDTVGERTTLVADGTYHPASKEIRARARMDSLQIGYASGFLKEVFSRMEGKASGEVALTGTMDRLSVSSRGARLDDALLHVAYTNVPYYVSGPFHLDDYGVYFDDMDLKDRFRGSGTVSGGLSFDHLKNIRMNTSIRVNGVEAFNTQDDGESPVYGNVSASGTVNITGPFSSLLLDINARTDGNGDFHIPLRNGSAIHGTDLLTFKQPVSDDWVDPYEEMLKTLSKKGNDKGRLALKMRITVRPEVQCDLEIDKDNGNVLSGRGNGTISLDIAGEQAFNINGEYNLTSGDFHFNAMNIASKDFTISSGSFIKFNGDIMDSDLDIHALYQTKTSLANLITDSTATSYRRNVECGLSISDKLRNPQLAFSIDIPDLDPATKSQVESALNTDDKIQKQFVALLVTNNFLPNDQSGIFNSSGLLMSNMMEVMSGQLSNILQRLQIPLDLGLKYAAGEGGNDLFDVAVSTKLFNDRVSVNGVIGNRQYSTHGNNQDVVGDLDVEIKLDNAGEFRLNLFSHSADKYSNYLDYSQRNGVGVGYQKEFNTLRSFFRNLFMSKKKRQEMQALPRPEERKKTLKIQKDER